MRVTIELEGFPAYEAYLPEGADLRIVEVDNEVMVSVDGKDVPLKEIEDT